MKVDRKLSFKPEDNAWVRYGEASKYWGGRKGQRDQQVSLTEWMS